MKEIWMKKIYEIDKIIMKTEFFNIERVVELYRKRDLLQLAFNRVVK